MVEEISAEQRADMIQAEEVIFDDNDFLFGEYGEPLDLEHKGEWHGTIVNKPQDCCCCLGEKAGIWMIPPCGERKHAICEKCFNSIRDTDFRCIFCRK